MTREGEGQPFSLLVEGEEEGEEGTIPEVTTEDVAELLGAG